MQVPYTIILIENEYMLYGLMGDCMKFLPNSATSFILSVQLLLHWLCLSDIEEEVLCGTR